jgi:subtilisin family serine protease
MNRVLILLCALFLGFTPATWAFDAEPTDQFLIELSPNAPTNLSKVIEAAGGTLAHNMQELGYVSAISDNPKFAKILKRTKGIRAVTPDIRIQWIPGTGEPAVDTQGDSIIQATGHLIDPETAFFRSCQWSLDQIDVPGSWTQGVYGEGTVVAVLDSGVSGDSAWGGAAHIDLEGQVVGNISMISAPSICDTVVPDQVMPLDFRFHGTFVAGQIAAHGFATAGIAPDAKIYGVKVLNCLGDGSFSDVIAGILHAANTPMVDVINMSLGAYFPKNLPGAGPLVAAMNKAVNYAQGVQGKLVVSAAGNDGADLDNDDNFISVPAQSGTGISAWAGDYFGGLASYSNHGVSGAWVGAGGGDYTPGVFIPSCALPFGHDGMVSTCSPDSIFFGCGFGSVLFNGSGTSFSAPLVAGVGALTKSVFPFMRGAQLKVHLKNTADDIGEPDADNLFSHGRVNASSAVQ